MIVVVVRDGVLRYLNTTWYGRDDDYVGDVGDNDGGGGGDDRYGDGNGRNCDCSGVFL